MKRVILVASLCVVGIVVAPIATASATFTGACSLEGTATFSESPVTKEGKILSETKHRLGYTFTDNGKGTCVETGTENPKKVTKVSVTAGEFEGTCLGAGASVVDGSGTLEVVGVPAQAFDLSFKTAAGVVALEVEKPGLLDEITATGSANFFNSKHQTAKECTEGGVEKLEFEATAAGSIG